MLEFNSASFAKEFGGGPKTGTENRVREKAPFPVPPFWSKMKTPFRPKKKRKRGRLKFDILEGNFGYGEPWKILKKYSQIRITGFVFFSFLHQVSELNRTV